MKLSELQYAKSLYDKIDRVDRDMEHIQEASVTICKNTRDTFSPISLNPDQWYKYTTLCKQFLLDQLKEYKRQIILELGRLGVDTDA